MAIAENRPATDRGRHGPGIDSPDPAGDSAAHAVALAERDDPAAWQAVRAERKARGVCWPTVIWIGLLHVGTLAAPFTFTWQGLVAMLVLAWLSAGIGICLGYHRLFCHRSFSTYRPVRWLIAWLGGLAGQGSTIYWVSNHRKHHALSDRAGDPHSPVEGAWWSHMLWLIPARHGREYEEYNRRWSPDLVEDPVMRFLDRTFILWHLLLGGALLGGGYWLGGWPMGLSLLVWGMFVRLVYVLHATWFVNSATHMWGYRNYDCGDRSRNLWWVALLTYGEGWHNNHHAYPRMASYGHKWWEFDITYQTIRLMERLSLAWDVVHYKKAE